MICKDCGFDMPAECAVIGNYWDCSSCKLTPKVTMPVYDEIYGPSPILAALRKQYLKYIIDDMDKIMEMSLFPVRPEGQTSIDSFWSNPGPVEDKLDAHAEKWTISRPEYGVEVGATQKIILDDGQDTYMTINEISRGRLNYVEMFPASPMNPNYLEKLRKKR